MTNDMVTSTIGLPEVGLAATTTQDKITTLEQKRQEKLEYLGANKQYANLDKSMTVMPGGNIESNKNKVWNDMSDVQVQDMISDAADQSLTQRNGKYYYNKDGREYTGQTERAYMYGTKADDGSVKFGLARGDLPSSDYRYQPGRAAKEGYKVGKDGYGWDPGADGVDVSKNYMDMLLPYNVATALEGAIHGRARTLADRKYPDYLSDAALQHASGVSEYYKSAEGMLGDTSKNTAREIAAGDTNNLAEYSKLAGAQPKEYGKPQQGTYSNLDELLNTPSNNIARGVASATLNVGAKAGSLVGRGVEAIGQITGSDTAKGVGKEIQDVYTKFQTGNVADVMTGYDNKNAQALQKEISDTIEKDGYVKALGKAVTDSRSLEVLATSVPEMVALAASVGGMAIANANNDINIGQAKLGREYTPEEKAMATVTSIVSTYLDRAGDKLAIGGMNGAKQALKTAIDSAPDAVKGALASKYGAGILKIGEAPLRLAGAGAVEGSTEYLQTLGQSAAQDPNIYKNGYSAEDLKEADVAGVLGAAMGTHMAVPGVAKDMVIGDGKLSSKQEEVLAKPEEAQVQPEVKMSPKAKDEFWAKVQEVKNDYLDEKSYRNRDDIRNIATDFLNGKDSTGILASDADVSEKLDKVKELLTFVAEDSGLSQEHKDAITSRLSEQLGIEPKHVANVVQEAEEVGNAVKTLKNAKDVEEEVTTGPRGFVTYYNNATTAMQNGDVDKANEYTKRLEEFLASQEMKQARILATEKEVMREYHSRVQMEMEASGLDKVEAGKKVYKEWAKERAANRGYAEVQYSDSREAKPFKLYKSQVVEHATAVANGKPYEMGGYKTIYDINRSIEAMNTLYSKLNGDITVSEGLPEVTKQWVDGKLEAGMPVDTLMNAVNGNSKLTSKQKVKIAEYVNSKQEDTLPKVEEVASKIMTGEKLTPADLQVQANDGAKVEEVLKSAVSSPSNEITHEEPPVMEEPASTEWQHEEPAETEFMVDEPAYEEPADIPHMEEPAHEDAVMPGEKIVRTSKPAIKASNAVELVQKKNAQKAEWEMALAVAKASGDTSKAKGIQEKLDKLSKYEEMKIPQTGMSKALEAVRKLYYGVDSKRLNSTLKVSKLTPLNVEDVALSEVVVSSIKESIPEASMTKSGKVNALDSEGDPARALLYKNDGSINSNVATAIWKGMNDYIATSGSGLARPIDLDRMGEMFPEIMGKLNMRKPEDVMYAFDMMGKLEGGGELLKLEAESIGSDIMKVLGLSAADGKVSERDIQGMKASLGMMAIHMAESKGLVSIKKVDLGGYGTVPLLQVGDKMKSGMDSILDEVDRYSTYDVPDVPKKTYSLEPIKRSKVEVHNQPYTDVTPLQREMKQTLDQMPFRMNDGLGVLTEMYGEDKDGLKVLLGYKSEKELADMSYDGRKAAESVNREIDTKVDGLYQMMQDVPKDGDEYKNVYIEWFVTKGGRTNSYATIVDPQSDKQLARWLVTAESSRVEVKESDLADNTPVGVGFKYGIVQAFEGALPEKVPVDKRSTAKVLAMADRIMGMSDEQLIGMVKDSEHIGHAMLAVANIRKAKQGTFQSDMVMEMDGLTNGLSFRLVQFPMDDNIGLLPKVGVVREDDPMWEAGTIADVKDPDSKYGAFQDLYETVVSKLEGKEVPLEDKGHVAMRDALKDVLPKIDRNMAKPAVMVTGYSAGETSTKLAIVNEQIGRLVEDIVNGKLTEEQMKELVKGTKVSADKLVDMLKENSIKSPVMRGLREKLTGFYMKAYAEPIYDVLIDTLGSMKKVGELVTLSYDYMYQVMSKEYEAELAKYKRILGQEEKVELMRKLLTKVGPIVRNSETVSELDRVLALSRKLVNVADEAKRAGLNGEYSSSSINARSVNGTDTVQMVGRTFGEPGAAGGVLQTHTEDNHTMARVMMKSKGKFNQVFDAQVLGIGQWDEVASYNKEFYELNKEFSMLNAVIEAVEKNSKSSHADGITVGKGKGTMNIEMLMEALNKVKQEVDANRAKIFGGKLKVGQMVGTEGTMYEVSPKEESARIEKMKSEIQKMLKELTEDTEGTINKALSDIVKNMGCK